MVPGMSFTSVRERLVVVVVAPPLIVTRRARSCREHCRNLSRLWEPLEKGLSAEANGKKAARFDRRGSAKATLGRDFLPTSECGGDRFGHESRVADRFPSWDKSSNWQRFE